MLQMEDDLLLECGLEIHQPNSRKKIDEKLVQVFETFASGKTAWGNFPHAVLSV